MEMHAGESVDVENPIPHDATNLRNSRHAFIAFFLRAAVTSGKLGPGPAESEEHSTFSTLKLLATTIPWTLLSVQLIWSGCVLAIAWALGNREYHSLSIDFWKSRLSIGPVVVYGVGWALFVLLGFFIREASARFHEAQASIEETMAHARSLLRQIRLNFPPGFWHEGDIDRIVAHLVAFPIALKMDLRDERDGKQLNPILHSDDIADLITADDMSAHCTRVVRAYIAAGEEDSRACFKYSAAEKTFAGQGALTIMILLVDAIDCAAMKAFRISKFRPSLGYINHLHIFLYIWLMFVPLVLVPTSGWFTILWALCITYCVGMLFQIAKALNEPYGYDPQDIKLNRLCAQLAHDLFVEYSSKPISLQHVLRTEHETPEWLEASPPDQVQGKDDNIADKTDHKFNFKDTLGFFSRIFVDVGSRSVQICSLIFLLWLCLVAFLSWGLTRSEPRSPGDRWFTMYIPVSTDTTFINSLGVFLLLSFWMNEAYSRYWNSLQTWKTILTPRIQEIAFQISIMCNRGLFHDRDRERILSHLAALPYAIKAYLRGSNDLSEISGILDSYDLAGLEDTTNPPARCLDVILGYVTSADAADPATQKAPKTPFNYFKYYVNDAAWDVERATTSCYTTRKFQISPSFTIHLHLFVTFWLILLPLSLVHHHGLLIILFEAPMGFAIIKLISIGHNLIDPFGDDPEDIPMDLICKDIQNEVHQIYHDSLNGAKGFVLEENYDHDSFYPETDDSDATPSRQIETNNESSDGPGFSENSDMVSLDLSNEQTMKRQFTVRSIFKQVILILPSVPRIPLIISLVWTVFVVIFSWILSKFWDDGTRGSCRAWCSPIDIDGKELGNLGVALFLLLSFRASDSIDRYEDGAKLLYDLKLNLRAFVVDFLYMVKAGFFHDMDRERVIAHVAQIPLVIRDSLLEKKMDLAVASETLLCQKDQERLLNSHNSFEYLTRTVETYLLVLDMTDRSHILPDQKEKFQGTLTVTMLSQISVVRQAFKKMIAVKEFPIITKYSNHQYLFTTLWLALLPMYMTSQSGFFAILWTPLISYGVLALQEISVLLVDPFGTDEEDLPIDEMLTGLAEEVTVAAESIGWESLNNTMESPVDSSPYMGAHISNGRVSKNRYFAHFENHEASVENFGLSAAPTFYSGTPPKSKPSLLLHMLRSVPWWALLAVAVWTAIGCVISYVVREKGAVDSRWWKSGISVGRNVGKFLSFGTFTLLGYYVKAAYGRYQQAGRIWGDQLRAVCHSIAAQMYTLFEEGTVHSGDHDRVLGHIAAIPLVLKHELRQSKDLTEVKGLLSLRDVARVQTAPNMTMHCVEVVRAYFAVFMAHKERHLGKPMGAKHRYSPLNKEIRALQGLVSHANFLNEVELVPPFVKLMKFLLFVFFIILPFEFAEVSGWITIFWVSMVAYGVLGMYSVAGELQNPFGMDVNDLDLDSIADEAVQDLLFLQKHYKAGLEALVRETEVGEYWNRNEIRSKQEGISLFTSEGESSFLKFKESFRLAMHAVSQREILFTCLWTLVSVVGSWILSRIVQVSPCKSQWFCTVIAVEKSLKGFVGFGVFLLLGFRLYDSHFRYVHGLRLWQDGIAGKTQLLLNRVLQSYPAGTWHEGDLERICGHLAAFPICLKASLRRELPSSDNILMKILGQEDVNLLMKAHDPVQYCIDVLRGYFNYAERLCVMYPERHPASLLEHKATQRHTMHLARNMFECRCVVRIPLPFGYVQHLRIFLKIWLLLLPLGSVEETGWLTILWVPVISYGVLGLNHWADELADPFGYDVSDVPLDKLSRTIINDIKGTLTDFQEGGVGTLVCERPAFKRDSHDER